MENNSDYEIWFQPIKYVVRVYENRSAMNVVDLTNHMFEL